MKVIFSNLPYIILIFCLCIDLFKQHFCSSDNINLDISIENIYNNTKNELLYFEEEEKWENIRIHIDYSNISDDIKNNQSYFGNLKESIEETILLYQSILYVRRLKSRLIIRNCNYNGIIIPDYIIKEGVNSDIIIFIILSNYLNFGILAQASPCVLSSYDHRPISGVIEISFKSLNFTSQNWKTYLISILFHELSHIFVFSQTLFPYFWDKENRRSRKINEVLGSYIQNGVNRTIIITPNVVSSAKAHFNCSSLVGVELENQGSSGSIGSHWERRIMNGDYMIGSFYEEAYISEITLSLFEDSGWYTVEKYTGGLFQFGRNEGCKFIYSKCIEDNKKISKYFCDKDMESQCYAGRRYKGTCIIDRIFDDGTDDNNRYFSDKSMIGNKYTDYCPIPESFMETSFFYKNSCIYGIKRESNKIRGEEIGNNSACFISNINFENKNMEEDTVCYKFLCNYTNYNIEITIGNYTVNCSENEKVKIPNIKGYILCPFFNEICSIKENERCYDMVDCIKKKSKLVNYNITSKFLKRIINFLSFLYVSHIQMLFIFFILIN